MQPLWYWPLLRENVYLLYEAERGHVHSQLQPSRAQSSGLNLSSVNFKVLIPGPAIYFSVLCFSLLNLTSGAVNLGLSLCDQTSCSQMHVKVLGFYLSFPLLTSDSPQLLAPYIKFIPMPAKLSLFLYRENLFDTILFVTSPSVC